MDNSFTSGESDPLAGTWVMRFHFPLYSHSRDLNNFILNQRFIAYWKTLVLSLIWIAWLQTQWSKYFEVWRVLDSFVTVLVAYSNTKTPHFMLLSNKNLLYESSSAWIHQDSITVGCMQKVHTRSFSVSDVLLCFFCKKTWAVLTLTNNPVWVFFCK